MIKMMIVLNDDNADNEIEAKKNNNKIIIVKYQRILKRNKIVKSVCFHVIPYIPYIKVQA